MILGEEGRWTNKKVDVALSASTDEREGLSGSERYVLPSLPLRWLLPQLLRLLLAPY